MPPPNGGRRPRSPRRARPGRRRGRRARPRRTTDPSSSTPSRVSFSTAPGRRSASLPEPVMPPPAVEHARDLVSHLSACLLALDAGHQQLVVAGVLVADGRRDRQLERLGLERAPGRRAADPARAAHRRHGGRSTAPAQPDSRETGARSPAAIRACSSTSSLGALERVALAPSRPRVLVGQALCLGALERAAPRPGSPDARYRLRARLKRTTTADRRLPAFARRVSAASPLGRNTRCPMSAQAMHTGPASSMISHPPCSSPHTEHVKSLTGETTTSSGGRLSTLSQPRSLSLRQLRRDPMRAVRPLDPGIARLREPQRPPVTGARNVRGLARLQPARLRPAAKRSASPSRSSPGSRPSPARDSRRGPGATHQPDAARASRRRPARRSRSRTCASQAPPPPRAPPGDRACSRCLHSPRRQTTRAASATTTRPGPSAPLRWRAHAHRTDHGCQGSPTISFASRSLAPR